MVTRHGEEHVAFGGADRQQARGTGSQNGVALGRA
jgi:hypothetical protein